MNNLKAHNISVKVGDRQIVNDVSFEFYAGELCGLIGPSGAGKSTLIRLMLRLQTPDIGKVVIGGQTESSIPRAF